MPDLPLIRLGIEGSDLVLTQTGQEFPEYMSFNWNKNIVRGVMYKGVSYYVAFDLQKILHCSVMHYNMGLPHALRLTREEALYISDKGSRGLHLVADADLELLFNKLPPRNRKVEVFNWLAETVRPQLSQYMYRPALTSQSAKQTLAQVRNELLTAMDALRKMCDLLEPLMR